MKHFLFLYKFQRGLNRWGKSQDINESKKKSDYNNCFVTCDSVTMKKDNTSQCASILSQ